MEMMTQNDPERMCTPEKTRWKTKTHVLKAGVERIVHVLSPVLRERMASGEHGPPMIGIRPARRREELRVYRHAEILGSATLMDTPDDPLPDTNGRGICYLVTTAAIKVYTDIE